MKKRNEEENPKAKNFKATGTPKKRGKGNTDGFKKFINKKKPKGKVKITDKWEDEEESDRKPSSKKRFGDKPFEKRGGRNDRRNDKRSSERGDRKPSGKRTFGERREESGKGKRFSKDDRKSSNRKPTSKRTFKENRKISKRSLEKRGENKGGKREAWKSDKNANITPVNSENPATEETMRLNKYVANSGVAARRKADELIAQGFVKVNDEVIKEMGYRVKLTDKVRYKDKIIRPELNKVYYLLNKPKNMITTTSDEKGRKTVMDLMETVCKERIYPVGRLDRNTTGLLLFTNDGDLAKKLSHPSYEVKKIYHAVLDKPITPEDMEKIRNGLTLEDGQAPVDKLDYEEGRGTNTGVIVTIHIGRNRIVRRIFAHLGYTVIKLDRIYYGGLTKKNLSRGFHRPLKAQEIIMLKHFI